MYEELTRGYKLKPDALEPYGFQKDGNAWKYHTMIMDGEFALTVTVTADGTLDTAAVETATGEEYVLYKTNAQGAFLGDVRTQVKEVLEKIISSCYMPSVFKYRQTDMMIEYVRKSFGDEPEFLWKSYPDAAVWRRKDNEKWYGVIMTVARGKVDGTDSGEMAEIVDLMMESSEKEEILGTEGYYPGWHMNKNSWFTIILDGTLSDEELKSRIDRSRTLAGGKNSYEKIYEVVKSIPEGKVATYGQVARLAGNPKWSRVVGYALHVNPEPGVIPCHRVVNSKGEPSSAFAFGGENRQIELLEKEGVTFTDGHVDMERFRWDK